MKIIEKLEILFGMAYLASLIAVIYFINIPLSREIAEDRGELDWSYWDNTGIFILISLHLLIPVCAWIHALKQSYVALAVIVIVGSLVILGTFVSLAIGSAFGGHVWIGVSPAIFAFFTILLAFINWILFLNAKQQPDFPAKDRQVNF